MSESLVEDRAERSKSDAAGDRDHSVHTTNGNRLAVKYNSSGGLGKLGRHARRLGSFARVWCGAKTRSTTFAGPLYAQVEPVSACNYSCKFCRDHADAELTATTIGDGRKIMPLEVAEELAADLARMGTLSVELIGRGEPLLHPRAAEFIEAFRRRNIEVNIYTHGALLTKEWAKTLVQLGVRTLRLSLNAATPESHVEIDGSAVGDFEKILGSARMIADARARAGTPVPYLLYGFVVMEQNYRDAKLAVQHASKAGMDAVLFKRLLKHEVSTPHAPRDEEALEASMEEAKQEAHRLGINTNLDLKDVIPLERLDYREASEQVYKSVPCYVPWYFCLITCEGYVRGCCQCKGVLGELGKQSFREIWNGPTYEAYRQACRDIPKNGVHSLPGCECDNCNYVTKNAVFHSLVTLRGSKGIGADRSSILRRMLRFKDV